MPAAAAVIRKVVQTSQFDEREHPEWTLPGAFAGRYSPWSSHLQIGRLARLVRRIGRKSNHGGGPIPGSAAAGFRPARGPLRLLPVRRLALPDPARRGDGAAYRLRGRADRRPPLARTLAGSRGTTPLTRSSGLADKGGRANGRTGPNWPGSKGLAELIALAPPARGISTDRIRDVPVGVNDDRRRNVCLCIPYVQRESPALRIRGDGHLDHSAPQPRR